MKKTAKIAILTAGLILLIVFVSFKISGSQNEKSEYDYIHYWTKAICNETHCQDYVIYCNGDEFVRKSPITGAVISIPPDWEDPRNKTMQKRVCELN